MELKMIDTEKIKSSPFQTRGNFDEEDLRGLAESYERSGIIDPLVVRARDNGYFELVSGERRLRAAKIADIKQVPCLEKELSDGDARYEQLVENIQRKDLDPLGRARAIDSLMKQEDWRTHKETAKKIGVPERTFNQWMASLRMPIDIQKKITSNVISMEKIERIAAVSSDEDKRVIFEKAIKEELSQKRVSEIVVAFRKIDSEQTFTIEKKEEIKQKIIETKEFYESPKTIVIDAEWAEEHPGRQKLEQGIGLFALEVAKEMGDVCRKLNDLMEDWDNLPEGGQKVILSHLEDFYEIRRKIKEENKNGKNILRG